MLPLLGDLKKQDWARFDHSNFEILHQSMVNDMVEDDSSMKLYSLLGLMLCALKQFGMPVLDDPQDVLEQCIRKSIPVVSGPPPDTLPAFIAEAIINQLEVGSLLLDPGYLGMVSKWEAFPGLLDLKKDFETLPVFCAYACTMNGRSAQPWLDKLAAGSKNDKLLSCMCQGLLNRDSTDLNRNFTASLKVHAKKTLDRMQKAQVNPEVIASPCHTFLRQWALLNGMTPPEIPEELKPFVIDSKRIGLPQCFANSSM